VIDAPFSPWSYLAIPTVLITFILNKYGYSKINGLLFSTLTAFFTLLFGTLAIVDVVDVPVVSFFFPRFVMLSALILPYILIDIKHKRSIILSTLVILTLIFLFDPFHRLYNVDFSQVNIELTTYSSINILITIPIAIILLGIIFLTRINTRYEEKIRGLLLNQEEKNVELEQQAIQIQNALHTIEFKNKNITDSIVYAQGIQYVFLPSNDFFKSIFPDSFVFFQPKDIVSGDFYWARQIGDLKIAISADCTGHGVPGALLSIVGLTLINDIVVAKKIIQPHLILEELRQQVKLSLNQFGAISNHKDGMDVSVCIIDSSNMRIDYSGAYNPAFLVRNKELIFMEANNQTVGINFKEMPFSSSHHNIEKGDCIYLFTDGFSSQLKSDRLEKYKRSRFKELLIKLSDKPMQDQFHTLVNDLKNWQGNSNQVDDILVIGIRI
jgi:serine phosphatase RsbU (regulator of sigma subunit)